MSADKPAARAAAFARRGVAHGAGLDAAAQAALDAALAPYRGLVLAGYVPIGTEIDPLPVMSGWDGPVCVPVIAGKGRPLEFHRWTPDCEMKEGPFGVQVPAAACELVPEVLIVPLLAFDDKGNRLGYGGGFYDRTLEGLRARGEVVALGFAYGAQRAEVLPLEPTDQRLDGIVTEAGLMRFA